jgi:hypothetical protein
MARSVRDIYKERVFRQTKITTCSKAISNGGMRESEWWYAGECGNLKTDSACFDEEGKVK